MYLRYHFRHSSNSPSPFRNPSTWDPPIPDNTNLRIFINTLWDHLNPLLTYPKHPHRSNLSPNHQQALHQLQQLQHIIIKPADKGGSIVLWPEHQYLKEAHRQLLDPKYYTPVPHNPIPKLIEDITAYLHFLHSAHIIDTNTYNFLIPHSPSRIPLFYMLPKIHKPNIPGRPIISGCDSPTEKLSIFVDHYLKTLVPSIPSYIRDTNHFLQTIFSLPTPLPENTILVTIDVTSLYTNIPHEEGIAASLKALSTLPKHSTPPLHVFNQFLTFILKHNFFSFNQQFYLQQHGTAMGTRMAPSYANIFMAQLETQLLTNPPNSLLPLLWKRYIDDIFMIWPHGQTTLEHFLQYMNNFHHSIKFQYTFSTTHINFLDTNVHLTPELTLYTTLYTKPTDSTLLLHHSSHHPNACKRGTIRSQVLRYRRLTTRDEDLCHQLERLRVVLLARGYSNHLITSAFKTTLEHTQNELLFPQADPDTTNDNSQPIIPFTVPFHPQFLPLSRIIRSLWFLISHDKSLSPFFPKPPIVSFMRHRNIKDTLVHTRFSSSLPPPHNHP